MADIDIERAIARAPLRTLRLRDIPQITGNTWRTVERLVAQGALVRLAHGVYTAPPDGRDGRTWKPPLEAAALAIATARFGDRTVALMGVSAARHWAAIPRAIGVAMTAVPRRGYAPLALEAGGTVRFVPRAVDTLDLILQRTNLGMGLVTTPAQTLLDLLSRGDRDGLRREVIDGIENLKAQVRPEELRALLPVARVPAGALDALAEMEAMSD